MEAPRGHRARFLHRDDVEPSIVISYGTQEGSEKWEWIMQTWRFLYPFSWLGGWVGSGLQLSKQV